MAEMLRRSGADNNRCEAGHCYAVTRKIDEVSRKEYIEQVDTQFSPPKVVGRMSLRDYDGHLHLFKQTGNPGDMFDGETPESLTQKDHAASLVYARAGRLDRQVLPLGQMVIAFSNMHDLPQEEILAASAPEPALV